MYIFDLHCDTLHKFYENPSYNFYENNGCISNTHLRLGGYLAQCFAIYLPPEIKKEKQYMFFKTQYNNFSKFITRDLKSASTQKEIINNIKKHKISAVPTVENADFLDGDFKKT